MNFNELSQEAYAIAKAHGWHDEKLPDETYLMLIITEIAEAVQADRKDRHAADIPFKEDVATFDVDDDLAWKDDFEFHIKNSVEDELCDIIIRCLDMSALRNCDLSLAKAVTDRNLLTVNDELPKFAFRMCWMLSDETDTLCSRLNYTIAAVIAYCKQKGIDIDFFVEQKMRYNKLRDYKHGNKKY